MACTRRDWSTDSTSVPNDDPADDCVCAKAQSTKAQRKRSMRGGCARSAENENLFCCHSLCPCCCCKKNVRFLSSSFFQSWTMRLLSSLPPPRRCTHRELTAAPCALSCAVLCCASASASASHHATQSYTRTASTSCTTGQAQAGGSPAGRCAMYAWLMMRNMGWEGIATGPDQPGMPSYT